MDGLLFLGAILGIGIVIVSTIIDNGRAKTSNTAIANDAQPPLLRKSARTDPPRKARRSF